MLSLRCCSVLLLVACFYRATLGSPTGSTVTRHQCPSASPLALSVNDFGLELSRQLDPNGNLFVSPLSIYTALAMTYVGARGHSATQIEDILQLRPHGLTGQDLQHSFKGLLESYLRKNGDYSLEVANGLFLQNGSTVKEEFISDLKTFYHAMVQLLDFAGKGEDAKNAINRWVADSTHNKIPKMLAEPLSPLTQLAILNAVYFKGTWKTKFNKDFTYDGTFYKNVDEKKQVKFMSMIKQKLPFFDDIDTGYKFLELPYKGEDIAMLLALPRSAEVYPEFSMTSSTLCNVLGKLRNVTLDAVTVPKFSLEYEKQLKDTLIALGVKDIFNSNADLSGITGERDLVVSSVLHKAVIDVNEEGSEAAATTGVFITKMSLFPSLEFIANHPFLFYIIDKRNGLVLFSGRVADP